MADVTPKTWKSAAILLVAAVLVLAVFAWWSGILGWPPGTTEEAREEVGVGAEDSDASDPVSPPATQPPIEGSDSAQPY